MKQFTLFLSLFFSTFLSAQNLLPLTVQDLAHSQQEKCYAGILNEQLMQSDAQYVQRMNDFEQYLEAHRNDLPAKSGAQYVVPVVFHVIHLGEPIGTGTNVSDEAIKRALRVCNERYRNMNNGGGADTQIEFALAVRDPNGNCTNGITRTDYSSNTQYANYGIKLDGSQGITDAQLKAIISWNRSKYYNIYIISEIDDNNGGAGTQGYAYMASSHGNSTDGAVFMASNLIQDFDQTMIHELGHAFNLYHTFEGDNNGNSCPPNSNPTTQGDRCADTPPHKRSPSDCNTTGTNSCDGGSSNALFVHNYMDYSSSTCATQFTADQGARMRAACASTRSSFFTSNNALVPVSAPTAGILVGQDIYCSGTVQLFDNSTCTPNTLTHESDFSGITHSWSVTNGSVNLTSTDQNPSFTLSAPGWYHVTLTVDNGQGTNTVSEQNAFYYSGTSVTGCNPNFGNVGPYAMAVSEVSFNTILSATSTIETGTYEDFICSKNTVVNAGQTYPISITLNTYGNPQNFKVYIDWDNNGTYSAAEKVFNGSLSPSGSTPVSQTFTGSVTIPATAVKNQLLRMRVITNVSTPTEANANCTAAITAGDVEDYGVLVKDDCPLATITTQPTSISICPNQSGTIQSGAAGADTYQWQVSTDNGATWTNVTDNANYSGATTATLSLTNIDASFNNNQYHLVAANSCGDETSDASILSVSSTINFTQQPAAQTTCANGSVTFEVVANGNTYQWQVSTDNGATWTDINDNSNYVGTSTASLTVQSIPQSMDGNQYRCVVSTSCTNSNSSVADLTVTVSNASITQQPQDATFCPNSNVSFSVQASNVNSYQWQISTDNGATWTDITNGGNYSGVTTTTLAVSSATSNMNGNKFRCVMTTDCGSVNSSVASLILTAGGNLNITNQPQDLGLCLGQNGTISFTATGASGYQWQVSTDNGATWTAVTNGPNYTGATTNTLGVNGLTQSDSGKKYRCKLSGGCGDEYTDEVTLTVATTAIISLQPSNAEVCRSTDHIFKVEAQLAANYQWQVNYSGGNNWTDLNDNAIYSGSQTATLIVNQIQMNMNNARFRCVIQGACGGNVISDEAKMIVHDLPNVIFGMTQVACINDSPYSIPSVAPSGGVFTGTGINGQNLFDPSVAGIGNHTITYTVTENGCSSSATQTVTVDQCLGAQELVKDELVIFPNPANTVLNIKGNLDKYQVAYLIDNQGRVIGNWDLNHTYQLDLGDYATGHYYLRVIGTDNTVTSKIEIIK